MVWGLVGNKGIKPLGYIYIYIYVCMYICTATALYKKSLVKEIEPLGGRA